MKKYILVIDEGTTGVRTIIFDKKLNIVSIAYEKLTLLYPQPEHIEQSANEIYEKTVITLKKAVADGGIDPNDIECIGLSTQRVTWVPWKRNTGEPIMNMVTWMDKRAIETFNKMKTDKELEKRFSNIFRALQPQHIVCGLTHTLDKNPEMRKMMNNGELMFGTVDTWITYKLTKGKVFASNASNASTTRLLNHETCEWNTELLDYLGFARDMFAEVKNEADDYGMLDRDILGVEIPITGMVADQQSALFAQGCTTPFSVKSTNGTGSFVSFNIGDKYMGGRGAYASLVAWKLKDQLHYMVEGFLPTAGAALEWAKNDMKLFDSFDDLGKILEETKDSNGVYFSPALGGFRLPLNDATARAAFLGITPSATPNHFVRAIVESIAYANSHIIEDVCKKFEIPKLDSVKISGGVARSELVGQMVANISDTRVEKPISLEASAMGAAEFAGIYTGTYELSDIPKLIHIDKVYKPDNSQQVNIKGYQAWKEAILRTLKWTF